MRVLWLSPWLRTPARICTENLIALGVDVMLVTADLHPEADTMRRPYEVVLRGRPVPTADWLKIPKTYREAKRFAPDVVVTEFVRDPRWRIFGGIAPRICIWHDDKPHDETHTRSWWNRSFDPWDRRADATIVFSEYVAQRLRDTNATPSPIHVAPLLGDLEASIVPDFVPAPLRENFLMIGRQRPYKNHEVVFAAWDAHTRGPAWRGDQLILLGEGDIATPLPPHTTWHREPYKYREVVDQIAHAKGLLVHARSASQSGVQLLAMQLGVPPIVSTVGGLPEYQPPGLSAIGVDDIGGLTRTFDTLADPEEVKVQSLIALDHYTKHYDATIAARRMLEIFENVAGQT